MGIVGWFILGILFIAFAFFGLNSYLDSDKAIYAASVNGVEISSRQENLAYQRLRKRMEEMMGGSFDPATLNESLLRETGLRQLINEELLFQEAADGGFAGSDQQLAAQINSINVFKTEGKFSKQRYERALANQGMSPADFEGQLRRGIISDQLRSGIVKTAVPTPNELELAYRLQGQQRRFSYLILPVSRFSYQVNVTEADVEQYYQAHGQEYMSPQKVKLEYIELNAANLVVNTEPDEATIRALYEEEAERFTSEEERHARHILVLFQGTDEASIATATRKAEEIVKRLDAGEAFDVLAREVSEDPGSASEGGDLGFFARGIMVPEFENAVFEMQVGERSAPIRSSYGLHIIELLDIKPQIVKPFEEVREALTNQFLSVERGDLYFEQSEILSNLAFEHPDTLEDAASALGLAIQTSDWIGLDGGPGIGENPLVVDAAFSDDVLQDGNNSNTLELDGDHIVVVRVLEHRKAEPRPLEEVSESIRQRLQDEQARSLAKAKGTGLLASLQSGTTLEQIAAQQALDVGRTKLLDRNASTPQRSLVSRVFSLVAPGDGQVSSDGFVMEDGNYALVQLEEVNDGRFESLDESARKQLMQELAGVQGAADMSAVMAALNEKATIHIPERENQ